jgi:hypothetical protein
MPSPVMVEAGSNGQIPTIQRAVQARRAQVIFRICPTASSSPAFGHAGQFRAHRSAEDHGSRVAARAFGHTIRDGVLSLEIAITGRNRPATPNRSAAAPANARLQDTRRPAARPARSLGQPSFAASGQAPNHPLPVVCHHGIADGLPAPAGCHVAPSACQRALAGRRNRRNVVLPWRLAGDR